MVCFFGKKKYRIVIFLLFNRYCQRLITFNISDSRLHTNADNLSKSCWELFAFVVECYVSFIWKSIDKQLDVHLDCWSDLWFMANIEMRANNKNQNNVNIHMNSEQWSQHCKNCNNCSPSQLWPHTYDKHLKDIKNVFAIEGWKCVIDSFSFVTHREAPRWILDKTITRNRLIMSVCPSILCDQ